MADDIQEAVADAAEFVSDEAERFAEFTRSLSKVKIQFGLLGAAFGATAGALVAWNLAYRKAIAEANERAEDEISEMREHYQAKGRALDAQAGKGDLEKIVNERGYSTPERSTSPPMAVQPPSTIVDGEDTAAGEPPDDSEMGEDDTEGPNGVKPTHEGNAKEPRVRNIFRDHEKAVVPEWDQHEELRKRSPDRPYVIHTDEKHELEGYSDVSFTYYAADDVLCNENDEVVDPAERDDMVGELNLERFGHGSGDAEIVFVRNDNLEMVFEIVKSPNSFAEEVHGFTHEAYDRGNIERMRRRERDEER